MEISDYMQETDVGFKKPKTKKKRSSRRAPLDVEETDTKMDVDGPVVPRVRDLDANFIDDDELQAALARSRKAKLQKAKKLTPEELARKSGFLSFSEDPMLTFFRQSQSRRSKTRPKLAIVLKLRRMMIEV